MPAGTVDTQSIADGAVTKAKVDWTTSGGVWWEELGRTRLATATSSIMFTLPTTRTNLKLIFNLVTQSAEGQLIMRFNNDTGSNYAVRVSADGAADGTATSTTSIPVTTSTNWPANLRMEADILDYAGRAKTVVARVSFGGANATYIPSRRLIDSVWGNTSNRVTTISIGVSAGTMGIGTELIVLGHD